MFGSFFPYTFFIISMWMMGLEKWREMPAKYSSTEA
jgi:hypothetical protein